MEVDSGNSFAYTIIIQFPTIFLSQTIKNQFPTYDAIPKAFNPKELNHKDIKNLLLRNQRKYGKSKTGNTLLEMMEIKK